MKVVKDQKARVAIAVPCGDSVKTEFLESCVTMCNHTMSDPPDTLDSLALMTFRSSILPDARNILAISAMEQNFTHILWMDSDMQFPSDTLRRLLAHRKPMVGVNAAMRRHPFLLTAETKPGEKLVTTKDSTGLEKVHRMGFGILLMDIEVIRKIKKKPYFSFEWVHQARLGYGSHRGEDYYFFQKAKRAGYELFVDQDLSKQIGHVGSFAFYPEMVGAGTQGS